jgi:hypothetical protein
MLVAALLLGACGGGEEPSSSTETLAPETGSSAAGRVTPLTVSGGGSRQFRAAGGDNSVQEFGVEGDGDELRAAAETVHEFYARRATGDWSGACAATSQSLRRRLEALARRTPGVDYTRCAPLLAELTADPPPANWRLITTIDAGSLRHDGEQAFLIYYGPAGTVHAMPMVSDGGEWKVDAVTSAQLPGAS